MRNKHNFDRGFFTGAVALIAVAGFVVLGLGMFTDLPALRTVGLVVVIVALVLGWVLAAVPFIIFLAFLDWIGVLPISRVIGWVHRCRERAEERAARRAGTEVLIENQYRFFAARNAPVAKPRDLRRVVNRLVRKLRRVGGSCCTLYGYTPVMEKRRVRRFGFSRVAYFLEHSEIRWNFGREHSDPTHELLFFSRFNGTHAVYLRISFVTPASNATCPGLFAELRLTPAALGVGGAHAEARVERIFRLLTESLEADFGHVELPGQPESEDWPGTPGSGPLVYVATPPAKVTLVPATTVKPSGRGSLIVTVPEANCENLKLCEQY